MDMPGMPDMSSNSTTGNDYYDLHDRLIIAHAVFASLTAMFLIPIALIAARYMRRNPVWFKIHSGLNTTAMGLIVIVFILGTCAMGNQFVGSVSDTHHRWGLATFLLVVIQWLVGVGAHFTNPGSPEGVPAPGKHWFRYVHIVTGIIIAGVVYGTVYSGFHEWTTMSDVMTATPMAVRGVYWAVFGIPVIMYIAGWWLRWGAAKQSRSNETLAGEQGEMAEKGVY